MAAYPDHGVVLPWPFSLVITGALQSWSMRGRSQHRSEWRAISATDPSIKVIKASSSSSPAQLGSIKWGIDSRGGITIESKDDMRKRGLPSPHCADAMAIAFAGRANAAPLNVESHAGESITGDLMTKAW
jgi:hypothetical protein